MNDPVLEVTSLSVVHRLPGGGEVHAVRDLSFDIGAGERVGLVGQSGSGKTAIALAVLGLHSRRTAVSGSIRLGGQELVGRSDRTMSSVRGARIAWMAQDSLAAFTPVLTIGGQMVEALRIHDRSLVRDAARARTLGLLAEVGLDDPTRVASSLPDEISGGMRQRAALALAFANAPDLIVADEPTSSLDVVNQERMLRLIESRCAQRGTALLIVTHDLRAVAEICDRIVVMERGRAIMVGTPDAVVPTLTPPPRVRSGAATVENPPSVTSPRERRQELTIEGLRREFRTRNKGISRTVIAVDGVDIAVRTGEAVGLIGESGSGKSTVLNEIAGVRKPDFGRIILGNRDFGTIDRRSRSALRGEMQVVLQDPASSLNPRLRVGAIIAEPLRIRRYPRTQRAERIRSVMSAVDLPPEMITRFPAQLSGGQRQRVAIARALTVEPRLLLLDEPVSALDSSLRIEVMDLLDRLRRETAMAYLLTSHDLSLTLDYVDRIVVLRAGRVMDSGTPDEIVASTQSYTRALLRSGGISLRDGRTRDHRDN